MESGEILMVCIDDVVVCILWVKLCVGLFNYVFFDSCYVGDSKVVLYCDLVWCVVCELLVLLKNESSVLLLCCDVWVLVVGKSVDSLFD